MQKVWFKDKMVLTFMVAALVLNALSWYLWVAQIGGQAYLIFTPIYLERGFLLSYLLPIVSLFVLLLNFLLYIFSYKKIKLLAYLFLVTGVFFQVLVLLVTFYYLSFASYK